MDTVARFFKYEDAYLFRSYLESEGIAAHVFDEYVPHNYWLYTHAIGGVRVVVAPGDAGQAKDFFDEYEKKVSSAEPVVGVVKAWPVALLVTFIIGIPMMIFGRARKGNP